MTVDSFSHPLTANHYVAEFSVLYDQIPGNEKRSLLFHYYGFVNFALFLQSLE
ncbi:MAG: hypothetical protein JWP69_1398 [Flaviaesturariibacter sp.]|nr:hypothetical protein [Flaviaesturariibacter sp.]